MTATYRSQSNAGAMSGTVIILMLKAPRLGQVKTRLAQEVGKEEALAIYRRLVAWQLRQLAPLQQGGSAFQGQICYTPAEAQGEMRAWLGEDYTYSPQCAGDLGARLIHALECAWDQGAERVVFLGGDCPFATTSLLTSADDALASNDVVVAPAEDGGYYLIGLAGNYSEVFHDINWGRDEVMAQTLARIEALSLKLHLLPKARDVDTLADWQAAVAAFPELGYADD